MRGLRAAAGSSGWSCSRSRAQVARNWLVLQGLGVDVSVFDSVALLIAAAVIGLLPVGPTLGVATAVVILGANGVALSAAAGALLTATAAVGALCFASWALVDRLRQNRPGRGRASDLGAGRRGFPAPPPAHRISPCPTSRSTENSTSINPVALRGARRARRRGAGLMLNLLDLKPDGGSERYAEYGGRGRAAARAAPAPGSCSPARARRR